MVGRVPFVKLLPIFAAHILQLVANQDKAGLTRLDIYCQGVNIEAAYQSRSYLRSPLGAGQRELFGSSSTWIVFESRKG